MDSMPWHMLDRFKQWEFLGLYPLPGVPANFHIVTKNAFRHQDLIASVDCMISKVGYGVYAECVLNGVPLIYVAREAFAEYPVLEEAIVAWGAGHCLSHHDYYRLNWSASIDAAIARKRPQPVPSDGAAASALKIENCFNR
jgi:UDP:flavonoid glycosyltransferase YjiC (YdhE family)